MTSSLISSSAVWTPVVWVFLTVFGALGLIALASPRLFSVIAAGGGHWFDSSRILARLDAPIDIDSRVLPYARVLGGSVLVAVAFLAYRLI